MKLESAIPARSSTLVHRLRRLLGSLAGLAGLAATLGPAAALAQASVQPGLVYCSPQGAAQRLNLHLPDPQRHPGLRPVAVYVHGGGWTSGSPADVRARPEIDELVSRGYAVAAVGYRFAPAHPFPAALDDVRCAVRFLRAQASRWSLDAQRVVAWGTSAGGHLAALLAYTRPEDAVGSPAVEWSGSSHHGIRAVALMYAPLDLQALYAGAPASAWTPVFGPNPAALATYSPRRYVRAGNPPTLLVHGTRDRLVPASQSTDLLAGLMAANVPAGLQLVANAGHSLDLAGGAALVPGRGDIARAVARFFDVETTSPSAAVQSAALNDLECVVEWLPTARTADFNGVHGGLQARSSATGVMTSRQWAGSQTWWATDGQQTWTGGGRFGSAGVADGPLTAAVAAARSAQCGLTAQR